MIQQTVVDICTLSSIIHLLFISLSRASCVSRRAYLAGVLQRLHISIYHTLAVPINVVLNAYNEISKTFSASEKEMKMKTERKYSDRS